MTRIPGVDLPVQVSMSVRGAVCVRVPVRVLSAAPEVRFQLPFVAVWTFYARARLWGFPLTGTGVIPESHRKPEVTKSLKT